MAADSDRLQKWWQVSLIVGAVYAAAMMGWAVYRHREPLVKGTSTSDYAKFMLTARHYLDTGRITPDLGVTNYLPVFTILMVPFAVLPAWLGASLMMGMLVAAVVLTVMMALHALVPAHRAPPVMVAAGPVLMAIPFIHACLVMLQLPILIGLLCLFAWWLVNARRFWAAGVPLAVALLLKPFLITLVVFLALKRMWRATLGTLLWAAVFGAGLSFLVMKPQNWVDAHREYYHRVIRQHTSLSLIAGQGIRYARSANQTIPVVLRRLFTERHASEDQLKFTVCLRDLSCRTKQAIYLLIVLVISGVTLVVGRHPLERIAPDRAHFEFAMFLLWGLTASPIVWTFYFPLVLYPLILLTVQLLNDRDAGRPSGLGQVAWWFWIIAAASLLTELVTMPYLRAMGVHMWATVLVWASMAACAVRRPLAGHTT